MAVTTHGVTGNVTTNAATYATGNVGQAVNDLLVTFALVTGTADAGDMTDSQGGSWTQITTAVKAASADKLWCFIRNARCPNADPLTVTMDVTGDNGTGCIIFVVRVSGMSRVGANAARQSAVQSNQAGATTPAPVFGAAVLTGNPTLGFVGNATNPAGMTPPASWTELVIDVGYATPTSGGEYVTRDSGFTGTTITWGSTSASAFGDIIVELDTSVPPGRPFKLASQGGGLVGPPGRLAA